MKEDKEGKKAEQPAAKAKKQPAKQGKDVFANMAEKLGQKNLKDEDVSKIIEKAQKFAEEYPDEAAKIIALAEAKKQNKEISDANEEKSPDKTPNEKDEVKDTKEKSEPKAKENKDSEGKEDKTTPQKEDKKENKELSRPQQMLNYRETVINLIETYKDDPLRAFQELSAHKPSAQAPTYLQQKYDADRAALLHNIDEKIRTSEPGSKYSPEKLGEELYKYQTNAETEAFAKEVLQNNQNNQELQESYKNAQNGTTKQEQAEQKKQEEQKKAQEEQQPSFIERAFNKLRKDPVARAVKNMLVSNSLKKRRM